MASDMASARGVTPSSATTSATTFTAAEAPPRTPQAEGEIAPEGVRENELLRQNTVRPDGPREVGGGFSLLTRTALTLVLSAVLIAGTAIAALEWFVVQPMSERWAADEAGLLELAARTWWQLPAAARADFELELAERHDLVISSEPRVLRPISKVASHLALLRSNLSSRLDTTVSIGTVRSADDDLVWVEIAPPSSLVADAARSLAPLRIGFSLNRRAVAPVNFALVAVLIGATIVLVTLLSLVIVQRVTRPLARAARSAQTFRGGAGLDPLPERGPRELKALARSFNTMAREVSELIAHRTTFLAGVSHDLRTPLARMRVAIELLPENVDPVLVTRLQRNLEEMDELLTIALQFARGVAREEMQRVQVRAFIESNLRQDGHNRGRLVWAGPIEVTALLAVGALRRVLQNLLVNAERHGGGAELEVLARVTDDEIELSICDRGPGIPTAAQDAVFQPFFRLDGARSRAGGSGLGLAIVKQLCDAHGWQVALRNRDGGGTAAEVRVPLRGH